MNLLLVCHSRRSCRKDREGLNRKVKNDRNLKSYPKVIMMKDETLYIFPFSFRILVSKSVIANSVASELSSQDENRC